MEIPDAAAAVFGDRLSLAVQYADLLGSVGVERGVIGPREVPRLWDRHLLNSAALAPLVAHGQDVVDLGSGAGLPGIPLAIARPDLSLHLVDAMERRCAFLRLAVAELGISATVVQHTAGTGLAPVVAPIVTARAVAPLHRLVAWAAGYAAPRGRLLALKGRRAQDEVDEARRDRSINRLMNDARVVDVGEGDWRTTVVEVSFRDHGAQRGVRT